jgi:DNA mismatch repair protein MutS2
MYTSFEEDIEKRWIKGKELKTLEFDKIRERLTSHAKSAYGRELCESLYPSGDFDEVSRRCTETQDTMRFFESFGQIPLSGLCDIRSAVMYADNGGTLSMKDLLDTACFLRAIARICAINLGQNPPASVLLDRVRLLVPNHSLEKDISFCIISEEEMNDRASDELYHLRKKIRDAQSGIREILEKIIRKNPNALQEQLVTLRNDRYVVPVKSEKRAEIPGIVHDTSSSGQTVFVEPMAVVDANNRIREWLSAEKEEINRILVAFSSRVSDAAALLRADMALVAEIDFFSAKANLAVAMKASVPLLNREGKIKLRKARHPLISEKEVVPIDFEAGERFRTLVVTGPNTGGKTVSLKTCGLLTLMTMAGLAIPCLDHSEVAVFRKVLADIGDEQSIEQSLSTFSSHMRNLVSILSEADESTLVLVDELGSGTDPSEGAALAIAILDEFRKKGSVTVATTHYKELKGYAIMTPGVENACCEFDTETLSPTYRLLIGLPGVSNAFVISRKLGLPVEIIDSAQAVLSQEGIRFEELLSSAEQNNRESEKLKKEIREMRDLVKKQTVELEKEKAEIDNLRKKILQEARVEKQAILDEALLECDQLLSEIKVSRNAAKLDDTEQKLRTIRNNLRAGLNDLEAESSDRSSKPVPGHKPDEIRLGALYFSASLGVTGVLVKTPDSRGNCVIASGSVRLTVSADSLRYPNDEETKLTAQAPGKKTPRTVSSSLSSSDKLRLKKASETMSELMLIGKTTDEATVELDRYLDDCVLSGISVIRIVHGKGSGALRSAVARHLRSDKRVKKFRLGSVGEGEDGVTIAEL